MQLSYFFFFFGVESTENTVLACHLSGQLRNICIAPITIPTTILLFKKLHVLTLVSNKMLRCCVIQKLLSYEGTCSCIIFFQIYYSSHNAVVTASLQLHSAIVTASLQLHSAVVTASFDCTQPSSPLKILTLYCNLHPPSIPPLSQTFSLHLVLS